MTPVIKSILKQANQLPPYLCRLLATRQGGWRAMSVREISAASNGRLSKSRVATIAALKSWDGVPIDQVDAFAGACGVDLVHPGAHKKWLLHSRLRHVLRAGKTQRDALLKPMITNARV